MSYFLNAALNVCFLLSARSPVTHQDFYSLSTLGCSNLVTLNTDRLPMTLKHVTQSQIAPLNALCPGPGHCLECNSGTSLLLQESQEDALHP